MPRHPQRPVSLLVLGLMAGSGCSLDAGESGGDAGGSQSSDSSDPTQGTVGAGTTAMTSAAGTEGAGPDGTAQGEAEDSLGATTRGASESTTTHEASTGFDTTTGEPGSSSTGGDEPVVCLDPLAGIPWAGDWGRRHTHACTYSLGLADPYIVDASDSGHDCFIVTAEVWIPGVTDVDGNQGLIRAETLITDPTGAVEVPNGPLGFEGRFGNNYRYSTGIGNGWWDYAPYGNYDMRFRFSYLEENEGCWYTIGLGDGPAGGAPRTVEYVP